LDGFSISAILFQVVGDRKGAVFGGVVEAPLRPSNKRKYQVHHSPLISTIYVVGRWLLHFATC